LSAQSPGPTHAKTSLFVVCSLARQRAIATKTAGIPNAMVENIQCTNNEMHLTKGALVVKLTTRLAIRGVYLAFSS